MTVFYCRTLLALPLAALASPAAAQSFGIGTATPHSSAQLEVASTTRGLLLPRLSQAQLDALGGPTGGLLAYNTTTSQLTMWNGTGWQAILTLPPAAALPPQVFAYSGQAQTYTVPAGVYALNVTLTGGSGGRGRAVRLDRLTGSPGTGATVSSRLLVTPGQTLEVRVGGRGTSFIPNASSSGGYNGGGISPGGGSGGGSTDLRLQNSGLAGRLLVAGGGGGAPSAEQASNYPGGSGGYPAGGTGGAGTYGGSNDAWAGKGGTQTAGGAGGVPTGQYGAAGGNGSLGQGGGVDSNSQYGGGGGGGYYGGGAGAAMSAYNSPNHQETYGGGGGGGGSSYAGAGATRVNFQSNGTTTSPADGQATLIPVATAGAPALDATNFTNLALPWQRAGTNTSPTWPTDNVGIGTSTPGTRLEVAGAMRVRSAPLEIQNDNASAYAWFNDPGDASFSMGMDRNANNDFKISQGDDPSNGNYRTYLTIQRSTGNVGIGTATPNAPLTLSAKASIGAYNFAYFRANYNNYSVPLFDFWEAKLDYAANINPNDVTLKAEGRFVLNEMNALSDLRLKKVCGLSNRTADLGLLRRLRITDYQMRDQAQYGARQFKKVLAQDVEEVFPQAVSQKPGYLPDIYAAARHAEALPGDSLLRLTLPAAPAEAVRAGQRLHLRSPAGEVVAGVVRAQGPVLVLRGVPQLAGQPVFVFGREHADVRAVDYEALAMLHISATQALDEQLGALRAQHATTLSHATQAQQAADQAQQAAHQATTDAAHATATIQDFARQLAAAEARQGVAQP